MAEKNVAAADLAAQAAEQLIASKGSKWQDVKDKLIRYLGALVMEKDKNDKWVISIGRTSWWLAFLPALYIFIASFVDSGNFTEATEMISRDITPNHLTVLLTLAGYNFGKKVADTVNKVWGKGDGPG